MATSLFQNFVLLQHDSEVRIHWKGAAEIVLASCTAFIDRNDQVLSLDEEKVCPNVYFLEVLFVRNSW